MSDFKEFLNKSGTLIDSQELVKDISKYEPWEVNVDLEDLGMFFWERGGKQFVQDYANYTLEDELESISILELQKEANKILTKMDYANPTIYLQARYFLDCVACLGEDEVKKLKKGVKL